jgi:TonB-dependent Receptor Plug Domain
LRKLILYLISLALPIVTFAQIVVKGKMTDSKTNEPIIGLVIFSKINNVATETDEQGQFEITLEKPDTLNSESSDYGKLSIFIDSSQTLDQKLKGIESTTLETVVISSEKDDRLDNTQMSVNEYTREQIKEIPAIFGEPDILKVIQLKPGVQINGEGGTGIYVRGGGPDQNLVLMDESVVYNPTHLFGFFSVFNSDIINKVKVYKGDFPASYGGRLSSVIDVSTKSPNKDSITGSGGIGLISSRFNIDLPLKKNKTALFLAARRTYFDVFTNALNKANENTPGWDYVPNYHFQDFNAKIEHNIGKKDKIFINGFMSNDNLELRRSQLRFYLKWGNVASTVKWNHIFNSKFLMSNSVVYSKYGYEAGSKFTNFSFKVGSKINEIGLKSNFEYILNNNTQFEFGTQLKKYAMELGRVSGGSDSIKLNLSTPVSFSDAAAYFNWNQKYRAKWKFEAGLRLNYVNNNNLNFVGLEPRASVAYKLNLKTTFKASYAKVYQNVHLITNSGSSLPIDYWYPSTANIIPQHAQQFAIGSSSEIGNKFFFSVEGFYKRLYRQLDFKNNANIYFNDNLENEMIIGKGWAYGAEFYLEKKKGRLTGWAGYTLAWSKRQFDQINNGEVFYARNDRRHDISIVGSYKLNKRVNLSASWVYSSGVVTTLPLGKIILQGFENQGIGYAPDYVKINNYRIPAYHRLDIGLIYRFYRKWGESDLTFSLYNTYSRRNTYFITFEPEQSEIPTKSLQKLKAVSVSLFPIIPSITYNFKF